MEVGCKSVVPLQPSHNQVVQTSRLHTPSLLSCVQESFQEAMPEANGRLEADMQCDVTGLRLGMYGPLKTAMGADTDPTALKKIAAGSASGAIATFITNPIELLKTRLQSNSAMAPLQVLQKIVRENGVTGLWKGTMPSAVGFVSAHSHKLGHQWGPCLWKLTSL